MEKLSIMSDEEDSDKDEQQNIDEKNLNENKKNKCQCTEGCRTHSCSCFKYGSGCNPSCGCGSSCENMFNHLEYFFGENQTCGANPCFAHWLVKHAKNGDDFKMIDRDKLRRRIMRSPK
jgi:hypothetical protein